MAGKVVLVSGASSGLGLAVAEYLFKAGHTVYAAARSFKEESIQEDSGSGGVINRIFLDVTDRSGIDGVVERIVQKEGKLDAVVNCAAYLVLGSVEDTSVEEYKFVYETNFIGTLNMCQAVLPVMRGQQYGKIVIFSSLNGIMGIPFQSAYVSSKFAIEGLIECLSMETRSFGIDISMIEPSDHRSGSKAYRPHSVKADLEDSPYYKAYKKGTAKIAHDEENGSDPVGVAKLVAKIIAKRKPRLRYTVGRFDERLAGVLLKRILPGRLFEKIIGDYYK